MRTASTSSQYYNHLHTHTHIPDHMITHTHLLFVVRVSQWRFSRHKISQEVTTWSNITSNTTTLSLIGPIYHGLQSILHETSSHWCCCHQTQLCKKKKKTLNLVLGSWRTLEHIWRLFKYIYIYDIFQCYCNWSVSSPDFIIMYGAVVWNIWASTAQDSGGFCEALTMCSCLNIKSQETCFCLFVVSLFHHFMMNLWWRIQKSLKSNYNTICCK